MNDDQGRGWSNAAALRNRLEWVSGRAYSAILSPKGTWETEKKVPLRKVIGMRIRLPNVAISS